MNAWQWVLAVVTAWCVIACGLAWVITAPYRRPAADSGPRPPVREAAPPERRPLPGLTWIMSTDIAECDCVHFLDHRTRRRVITHCDEHKPGKATEFSVREWNERLEQS